MKNNNTVTIKSNFNTSIYNFGRVCVMELSFLMVSFVWCLLFAKERFAEETSAMAVRRSKRLPTPGPSRARSEFFVFVQSSVQSCRLDFTF